MPDLLDKPWPEHITEQPTISFSADTNVYRGWCGLINARDGEGSVAEKLSNEAQAALERSKDYVHCTPYCFQSEQTGRQNYLEQVVLADNPAKEAILAELASRISRWTNFSGD